MHRRKFIETTLAGTAVAVTAGIASTRSTRAQSPTGTPSAVNTPTVIGQAQPSIDWQMPTSFPVTLDTLFGGAQFFVERVSALTNGKFRITPHPSGELAPSNGVLDVVSQGTVPIGYTSSFYYITKSPVMGFGTAMPFGLTAQQQNAWLYQGGGLSMLQDYYRSKFGIIQFPVANSGAQMGGWFRKEIKTLADLQGLTMRIPGLGGQVMSGLGVKTTTTPGDKILAELEAGALDAAEWTGPYDDEKLGLAKVAPYYVYPGWWEPGASIEVEVNLKQWNDLPAEYQAAIQTAAAAANIRTLSVYETLNAMALPRLVAAGVKFTPFSKEILTAAQSATNQLFEEFSAKDSDFKTILAEWTKFREAVRAWNKLNEFSFTSYVYGT